MGWDQTLTSTKGKTALALYIECAHPSSADRLARAVVAHGTTIETGQHVLWLAVRWADGPDYWQHTDHPADVGALCVLYTKGRDSFTYKHMDEGMHPGYGDVPDNVWQALTPLRDIDNGGVRHAGDWREMVERIRAERAPGARRRPKPGEQVTFDDAAWGDNIGDTFVFEGRSIFRPLRGNQLGDRVRLRGWSTVGMSVAAYN